MLLRVAPSPALRPFVRQLWAIASDGRAVRREHVLPTGCMAIAIRVTGPALRLFRDPDDFTGQVVGHAVVGGARVGHYVREAGAAGLSVGAQLEPGAAGALFGEAADALAQRHTRLEDLWGAGATSLRDQLAEAPTARAALATFDAWLLARVPTVRGVHPGVAESLLRLRAGATVADAVAASGLSHRHLIARFREATGLAPKQHARVLRLQRALEALQRPGRALCDVALEAGYSDQAHFSRDFHVFAGMTPGQWRQAAPENAHHVAAPRR